MEDGIEVQVFTGDVKAPESKAPESKATPVVEVVTPKAPEPKATDTDATGTEKPKEADPSETPSEEPKTEEAQEKPKEEAEKPKPWRKSKPSVIPYDRFSEVVAERTAEKAARERLEQELAEYKKRLDPPEEEVSDLPDPVKLDPADFNSPQEFFAAQADAMKKQIDYQVRQQLEITRQNATEAEEGRQIASTYTERLQAAAKADPELLEVDEFLGTLADPRRTAHPIPDRVARALIQDEYAPWVAKAVASDERCLKQLQYGDPMESMIMLGQISGYIRANASSTSDTQLNVQGREDSHVQDKKNDIEELRESIPDHTRSGSGAPTIRNMADAAKYLSQKDYNAWCIKNHK